MLKNWYKGMTKGQPIFVWSISVLTIPVALIGVIPTLILIYLHLGNVE